MRKLWALVGTAVLAVATFTAAVPAASADSAADSPVIQLSAGGVPIDTYNVTVGAPVATNSVDVTLELADLAGWWAAAHAADPQFGPGLSTWTWAWDDGQVSQNDIPTISVSGADVQPSWYQTRLPLEGLTWGAHTLTVTVTTSSGASTTLSRPVVVGNVATFTTPDDVTYTSFPKLASPEAAVPTHLWGKNSYPFKLNVQRPPGYNLTHETVTATYVSSQGDSREDIATHYTPGTCLTSTFCGSIDATQPGLYTLTFSVGIDTVEPAGIPSVYGQTSTFTWRIYVADHIKLRLTRANPLNYLWPRFFWGRVDRVGSEGLPHVVMVKLQRRVGPRKWKTIDRTASGPEGGLLFRDNARAFIPQHHHVYRLVAVANPALNSAAVSPSRLL